MEADLQRLLTAWLSGEVDEDGLVPLVDRLRSDEEFRSAFVAEISLLGQLKAVQTSEPRWLELEDMIGAPLVPSAAEEDFESRVMDGIAGDIRPKTVSPSTRFPLKTLVAFAVAACLITVLFYYQSIQTGPSDSDLSNIAAQDETDETPVDDEYIVSDGSADAVAVLSQAVDAKWDGSQTPVVGESLAAGDLRLLAGTVQLEFVSGVRLLLRGPADIELRAADEVFLREGSASCFVTEMGRGFRIMTKDMEVIDVGTAFSIDAGRGRQPEVHVLEGSVEIKAAQADMLALKEHHAIRMTDAGPETVEYSPDRFPRLAELRKLQNESSERKYKVWQQQAGELSNDPAVLLHYKFEESGPSPLEVQNTAADRARATDGVIIGCNWTTGRWPSKRAILYRNSSDRVLFQVPGACDSLTMLVWVRIDALTQQTTSLLMTESPNRRARFAKPGNRVVQGALSRRSASKVQTVRWELTQKAANTTFNIGYGSNVPKDWVYLRTAAPNPVTQPDNWGQWSCLVVTSNVTTGEVFHYVNGQRSGTGKLQDSTPLLLDFMELGNFGASADELQRSSGRSQRRFYGAIDEVFIANRVFNDSEIENIWLTGKP